MTWLQPEFLITLDLLKIIAGANPQRAAIIADLTLQLSFIISGPKPFLQNKKFRISAFRETGVTPYLDATSLSFSEYAPFGGELGYTLISIAPDHSSKTTTKAQWRLIIVSGISNVGTSWLIDNVQSSMTAGANPGIFIARTIKFNYNGSNVFY